MCRFRGVEEKAASTSGHRETVVAMTTATAMVMPRACGRSPSTPPSTTGALPCTMRAAPPPWHPHSATGGRGTQRPASWVSLIASNMCYTRVEKKSSQAFVAIHQMFLILHGPWPFSIHSQGWTLVSNVSQKDPQITSFQFNQHAVFPFRRLDEQNLRSCYTVIGGQLWKMEVRVEE